MLIAVPETTWSARRLIEAKRAAPRTRRPRRTAAKHAEPDAAGEQRSDRDRANAAMSMSPSSAMFTTPERSQIGRPDGGERDRRREAHRRGEQLGSEDVTLATGPPPSALRMRCDDPRDDRLGGDEEDDERLDDQR